MLALITQLDAAVLVGLRVNPGDALIMLSHVMLAGYTLALRWRPPGIDALTFLACFALVALVPVGIAYALEEGGLMLNRTSILGLAYIAVFPALLAYHFWNLGVAAVGSARAGVFLYLTPFFGAALAVVLLGERFGAHHAIGMALIIGGVAMATRKAL